MELRRMTERQVAVFRRLCAGQSLDDIAAADGLQRHSIAVVRREILAGYPPGTVIADLCRATEKNDPLITPS
jgi:hypothetical protein